MSLKLSRPNPGQRENITQISIFTFLCGASKDFMKASKAFIKPEAPQRNANTKFKLNFILMQLSEMHGA